MTTDDNEDRRGYYGPEGLLFLEPKSLAEALTYKKVRMAFEFEEDGEIEIQDGKKKISVPYKKGWYGSTVIGARKEESGGYEFEIEYDPIVHDGVEHKGGTEFKNLEEVVLGMKQAARKKRESAFVHIPDFRDRFAAIGVLARATSGKRKAPASNPQAVKEEEGEEEILEPRKKLRPELEAAGTGGGGGRKRKAGRAAGTEEEEDGGAGAEKENSAKAPRAKKAAAEEGPVRFRSWREIRPGLERAPTAGAVHKVHVKNFMCHTNMEMEFGPHITFVSGQNGSGKSASLQALQCCLGVTARETARASSYASFIRAGAQEAHVAVYIWNTGDEAFRPDKYGPMIIVERTIRLQGGAPYVLKNANGLKVSTRREDLEAMKEHLNLNAANPVAVLTQDGARSFLAEGNPKKIYDLYMDATLLATNWENIRQAKGHVDSIRAMIEAKRAELAGDRRNVQELREQYSKALERHEEALIAAKLIECTEYAMFLQSQQDVQAARQSAESVLPRMVNESRDSLAALEAALASMKAEMDALEASMDAADGGLKAAEEEVQQRKRERETAKARTRDARKERETLERSLEEKRRELEAQQGELQKDRDAERRVHEQELSQLQSQQEQLQSALREKERRLQQLEEREPELEVELRRARDHVQMAERELKSQEAEKAELERSLNQARNTEYHRMVAFGGEAIPDVLKAVEDATHRGRIGAKPLGPIGMLLKADKKWALVAEEHLKAHLEKFLCNAEADWNELRRIGEERRTARPLTSTIRRLDVPLYDLRTRPGPPAEYRTLIEALDVLDHSVKPPIFNFLVDNAKVHTTVLANTRDEADYIVRNQSTVTAAYTPEGNKFESRGKTIAFTNASVKVSRIASDGSDMLEEIRARVADLTGHIGELRTRVEAARAVVRRLEMETNQCQSELSRYRREKFDARTRLDTFTTQQGTQIAHHTQLMTQGADNDLASDMELLAALQQEVATLGQILATAKEKHTRANATYTTAEEAHNEAVGRYNDLMGKQTEWGNQFQKLVSATEKKEREVGRIRAVLEVQENDLEGAKKKLAASLEENKALKEALSQSEEEYKVTRVAVEGWMEKNPNMKKWMRRLDDFFSDADAIVREIARINKLNERAENEHGSLEDLSKRYEDAKAEYEIKRRPLAYCETMFNRLESMTKERETQLGIMDRETESIARQHFQAHMRKKGHMGNIRIDRKDKTLTIQVKMAGHSHDKASKGFEDLKALSGGERSFTTLSFMLTLGHFMESPFRVMDEFDVFMDSINRRVSISMLLETAYNNPELQFIFLTPQDITAVEDAKKNALVNLRRERRDEGLTDFHPDFVKIVTLQPARGNE